MVMHKKSFTVDVDDKVSDDFSAQVNKRGYTKYRAIEGALRAFMALPSELQVQLMSTSKQDIYRMLVRGLVETEVSKHLDKLGPIRAKFLALLKEAKEQESQKR